MSDKNRLAGLPSTWSHGTQVPMWPDRETDVDYLNFSDVAAVTSSAIASQDLRPISIGIFGGWGAGKSSMLRLIEQHMNARADSESFLQLRFDAWLYQGYDDARAALMENISRRLIAAAKKDTPAFKKANALLKRVNYFRAAGLALDVGAAALGIPTLGAFFRAGGAIQSLSDGSATVDDVEALRQAGNEATSRMSGLVKPKEEQTPPEEIAAFRDDFSGTLEDLNKTLVVYIDNLDRCLPQQTINTLEAIRLFLFTPGTAFVITADEDMIRHAVRKHYDSPDDRLVTDYLDKFIQLPVRVPKIGLQEVRAYMWLLFCARAHLGGSVFDTVYDRVRTALAEAWKSEPISLDDVEALLGTSSTPQLRDELALADRVAPIMARSSRVQGNPRIVKRLLNVVRLRHEIANNRQMPIDEAMIAKFALFERCTDDVAAAELYRHINETADGKPEVIALLEQSIHNPEEFEARCPEVWKPQASFLLDWFSLDPRLDGVDLRPAAYLSRETLPLRAEARGLSAGASAGLRMLKRARNANSRAAKEAVGKVEVPERIAIMRALIDELRRESDWTKRPSSFNGALILARNDSPSGQAFRDFIRGLPHRKPPPWLNAAIKDEAWYKEP